MPQNPFKVEIRLADSQEIQTDFEVQLAARDPSNTDWQRDLSVSYDNIGNVQRSQGDLPSALSSGFE